MTAVVYLLPVFLMPFALGFQRWNDLLFIHREADPAQLQRRLPAGLRVDTFEGRAYVSLIPFRISESRPLLFPRVLRSLLPGSSFAELNVRTYVRGPDGEPAVWFFSLDATSPIAVTGARLVYRLPYFQADISIAHRDGAIEFSSRRRGGGSTAKLEVSYRPTGDAATVAPGTLDHFLIERYVLFGHFHRGLLRASVEHLPYKVRGAEIGALHENLLARERIDSLAEVPVQHYAEGLDVRISSPAVQRLPAQAN